MKPNNKCEVPMCRNSYEFNFIGHKTCNKCWYKHCDGELNLNEIFNINERRQQKELHLFDNTTSGGG